MMTISVRNLKSQALLFWGHFSYFEELRLLSLSCFSIRHFTQDQTRSRPNYLERKEYHSFFLVSTISNWNVTPLIRRGGIFFSLQHIADSSLNLVPFCVSFLSFIVCLPSRCRREAMRAIIEQVNTMLLLFFWSRIVYNVTTCYDLLHTITSQGYSPLPVKHTVGILL